MRTEFLRPAPDLARYVDRIWAWAGRPEELPTLLPGTGAELVFHHGDPLVARTPAGPRRLPAAHLLCLRRERWPLTAAGPVRFTAVRLRAGALHALCPAPATAVVDQVVGVGEAFGPIGDRLAGAVRDRDSLTVRTAVIEDTLRRLAARRAPIDPRVSQAVQRVYRDPATLRVDLLGPRLGVSPRHLRRGFLTAVGVGPKEFQRLARFQRTIRTLMLSDPAAYSPVALSAGYFDQSHFIKEFRRLAGEPPGRLLRRAVSHFYYPSLGEPVDHLPYDSDLGGTVRR